jgi:hypothetical protein
VRNELDEELEAGLVRRGDHRVGAFDSLDPDRTVLARRERVGDLRLETDDHQVGREVTPLDQAGRGKFALGTHEHAPLRAG